MSQTNISESTIMFTDIVGYSAMVGKDESDALSLLDEHNNIIFPIIEENEGQIIKLIGDAIFARFLSAYSSLNAATKIQNILSERNSVSKNNQEINIRIGLHSGKVIEKDNDLFGHDVNLCSRIESMSPSGGIAASAQLVNSITSNDFLYREMGFVKLKNIADPHQIYKVYLNSSEYEAETDKQLQQNLKDNGINIVDINSYSVEEIFSIAVLYITNLGSEPDESIAYSLTESLIDDLGYFNSLRIVSLQDIQRYKQTDLNKDDIGRKLSVNHILQGSILKEDQEINLSFELVDIDTGTQLWEQKWSDKVTHIKGIRKTILDAIISKFDIEFPKELLDYFSEEMSQSVEAIEEYNLGKYCMDFLEDNKDIEQSIVHFDKAINLDNNFVEAFYMLALSKKRLGYYDEAENALEKGENIAESKKNLHGLSYIYRGYKSLYTTLGKYDKAKDYIVKALNTHLKLSHYTFESFLRLEYAYCLNNLNQLELSLEQTNLAIKLLQKTENERWLGNSFGNLHSYYLGTGDYTKSIENAKKGLAIFNKHSIAHNAAIMMLWIGETYYRTGNYEDMLFNILEAEKILSGLNEHFREAKIEYFKSHYALHNNDRETFLTHIDISIEKYNLSQNTNFEFNALIDKLYILLDNNETSKIDLVISKLDALKKRTQDLRDNTQYGSMIYYYNALKGDVDRDSLDKWKDDLFNNKKAPQEYNIWIVFWFLARTYHILEETELSEKCHNKAKGLLELYSKKISGDKERKTFFDVYFNKKILEAIKTEEIKDESESEISLFPFCPSCGFKNENSFAFCPSCGNDLKQ